MRLSGALAITVFMGTFLSGCGEKNEVKIAERPLARAGNEYIYQSDLDHHLSSFGDKERAQIVSDSAVQQRFLESIAISEVMAQKQRKLLSDDELGAIEAAVRAYRRQTLAAEYAASKMSGRPITMDELLEWYNDHPKFSGQDEDSIPFEEAIPELRRELGVRLLRDKMIDERKQFNKDIEYFD